MDASERFTAHEALKPFDAERELAQRKGSLRRETSRPQPLEIARSIVFRAVDDAQVLGPPTFYGWLHEATPAALAAAPDVLLRHVGVRR